jgi:hypothetical protein
MSIGVADPLLLGYGAAGKIRMMKRPEQRQLI